MRFRRRRTDADKRVWADKLKEMRKLYEAKCSSFWRTAIAVNKDDSKKLCRALHGVLDEATAEETGTRTADEFATYFKDKIDSVRVSTASTPLFDVPTKASPTLAQWTAMTHDEVEQMIGSALNKTCQLDPAPTWLIKDMRGGSKNRNPRNPRNPPKFTKSSVYKSNSTVCNEIHFN